MTDSEVIDAMGGPAAFARRLQLQPERGQVQRVHNWRKRGIPARIRLQHAELFAQLAGAAAQDGPGDMAAPVEPCT